MHKKVWLTFEHYQKIFAEAFKAAPEECLGLLFGQRLQVKRVVPLKNVAPDPRRYYRADPVALLKALKEADARSEELVAIYHSHPHGPQLPSETDRQEAYYAAPYLIASLPEQTLRAFDLQVEVREVDLIVTREPLKPLSELSA